MFNRLLVCINSLLLITANAVFADENWQPLANEQASIIAGKARFTVLTPALIRMEYHPEAKFRDQASLVVVNRKLPLPEFTHRIEDRILHMKTSHLSISYQIDSGAFNQSNLTVSSVNPNEVQFNWKPTDANPTNLGGTARTLDGMNGGIDWNGEPLDLGQGILSRAGWFLLDDSQSHTLGNVGASDQWPWVEKAPGENYQDWYFFGHGTDYKQALQDYTAIAGKIPMPPKYAFGYWWSRYWVYSDRELRQLMNQFRDYDIPIDVLVIDMDWHLTHGGLKDIHNPQRDPFGELLGWTGYTWNKELFPEPEEFLDWTKTFYLKTALNLHPASGIPPMEEQYQAFADDYGFDTSNNEYIPYRLAEQRWAESYVNTILRPLEQKGVDFWWLDWQQFPESKVVEGLNNTWWLNYVFFTDMERQNKRPLLFHRWGGMGNHRYQIGFSGDDKISWESLRYQSYFTATASNVGYGYWSHDIGGHHSGELDRDAQLYLRWLQFGVFSPILRTHSAKISSIERRFWYYPEHFDDMRELVKLRYSLNPYIYSTARQAYDSGVSIVRPMYYDHPKQEQAYSSKYQYMFGDDLLVAPVASPVSDDDLLAEQSVWLPQGDWYEWYSGSMLQGGKTYTRFYAQDEIPLFAKAGSIIPMYQDINHLQQQVNQFNLVIVPGVQGATVLYEDNGENLGYQQGQFATTKITQKQSNANKRIVSIAARKGQFDGMLKSRQFTLSLPSSFPVKNIMVNGKPLANEAISYEANQLANVITLPEMSADQAIQVELHTEKKHLEYAGLLDGKIGQFNRLSKAVADLKVEVARSSWWATLPNLVLGAEQTPTKINYDSTQLLPLLQTFNDNYEAMFPMIRAHKDARPEVAERYIRFLSK